MNCYQPCAALLVATLLLTRPALGEPPVGSARSGPCEVSPEQAGSCEAVEPLLYLRLTMIVLAVKCGRGATTTMAS